MIGFSDRASEAQILSSMQNIRVLPGEKFIFESAIDEAYNQFSSSAAHVNKPKVFIMFTAGDVMEYGNTMDAVQKLKDLGKSFFMSTSINTNDIILFKKCFSVTWKKVFNAF